MQASLKILISIFLFFTYCDLYSQIPESPSVDTTSISQKNIVLKLISVDGAQDTVIFSIQNNKDDTFVMTGLAHSENRIVFYGPDNLTYQLLSNADYMDDNHNINILPHQTRTWKISVRFLISRCSSKDIYPKGTYKIYWEFFRVAKSNEFIWKNEKEIKYGEDPEK